MEISTHYDDTFECEWCKLQPVLQSYVKHLVYTWRIPIWCGQEEDVINDIVQETARRIIERMHKFTRGEAAQIRELDRMAIIIARNYCRDLIRREMRLRHFPSTNDALEICMAAHDEFVTELDEEAIEHVYIEQLFDLLVEEIAKFPEKQRQVLLSDLACRMSFDGKPTPLQRAFLNVGIRLNEYYQSSPATASERSRALALLYHAYKRVAHLPSIQRYTEVA